MVYTLGPADNADWDDYPSTRRVFWSKSYDRAYLADFEEGYAAGKASLTSNDLSYFAALDATEVSLRKEAWRAKVDGWTDATFKARGLTKYG